MRRLAGDDPEVNEEWICDKDRFAFHYADQDDRLTYPLVRDEDGALRPASWPEALAVAARGLQPRPARVGGADRRPAHRSRTPTRYSKFARVALGTNDIDFRARPHTAEEADFLAAHVGRRRRPAAVTYADLETAPDRRAGRVRARGRGGAIFLRLRKAVRAHGTRVLAIAPFSTRGLRKLAGTLVPTAPGDEAAALDGAGRATPTTASTGPRSSSSASGWPRCPARSRPRPRWPQTTGARLAWVPRRAGDRGALEAGCLPTLLPGGRPVADAAARVDVSRRLGRRQPARRRSAATPTRSWPRSLPASSAAWSSAASTPPTRRPGRRARRASRRRGFVVSLELRETEVTEPPTSCFPVAPVSEKAGTFVNWEGRPRPFDAVLGNPASLPDLRVLAGIAEELAALGQGSPLGFRTVAEARAAMDELGRWDGDAPAMRRSRGSLALGTLDHRGRPCSPPGSSCSTTARCRTASQHLAATARPAVARISATSTTRSARRVTVDR